jgi:hypothetical protein
MKWHSNLKCSQEEKIELRTAATAFMDDTTWIASSKSNMQKILDKAAIFYRANNSQINSKKSVLIAINASKDNLNHSVLIGPNKEILQKTEENEFARYLGIWLGEKDHKKYTINLVQREIFHITQALKYKKTTDKQILYILNRMLISRIEYRIQHYFISENKCKKLTAKYMGKFKNAINISKTCANSIMLHKGIYNLKSIWEIQKEALIANFTNSLNDIGPTGKSTRIRLKDAQILNWEPANIIKIHTTESFSTKGNFQANALILAHSTEIVFQGKYLHNIFEWKGGKFPIKKILQNHKLYRKSRKHMAANNIMFLDQLIYKENNILISWQMLTLLRGRNNKGRTPTWFNNIKDITTSKEDRSLKTEYTNLPLIDNKYSGHVLYLQITVEKNLLYYSQRHKKSYGKK